MKTAIDAAGRVIVPKALRAQLGLAPGRQLEIQRRDGVLVIEPVPTPVTPVKRGKRRREAHDTSVLVASFASWHEHHDAAFAAMGRIDAVVAHCLLETVSVLTRLPAHIG